MILVPLKNEIIFQKIHEKNMNLMKGGWFDIIIKLLIFLKI